MLELFLNGAYIVNYTVGNSRYTTSALAQYLQRWLIDHSRYSFQLEFQLVSIKVLIIVFNDEFSVRSYIVFRNRVLHGFMFVYIYIYTCIYLSSRWQRSGTLDLFSLNALSLQLRSPFSR